jgi:peptidoglycan-associated lipoprotein
MRNHQGLFRLSLVLAAGLALAACSKDSDQAANQLNPALNPGAGGIGGGAGVPGSSEDFRVNVGDRVFFDTDSPELSPQAMATLDRQAQWLSLYPNVIVLIEGHADERGTREYNIALGARRATAVVNYLISRGIAPNRMSTISYGKERPVAVCNDISCWSQNRRAVTVVQGAGV